MKFRFQSGEEESPQTTRIDEESDNAQEDEKTAQQKLNANTENVDDFNQENPPKIVSKTRHVRVSKPIPIGVHHTVCGSEATNLAKRLSEELASQQALQGGSLGNPPKQHNSPDEPRSRSFEQGDKTKGNLSIKILSQSMLFCLHRILI